MWSSLIRLFELAPSWRHHSLFCWYWISWCSCFTGTDLFRSIGQPKSKSAWRCCARHVVETKLFFTNVWSRAKFGKYMNKLYTIIFMNNWYVMCCALPFLLYFHFEFTHQITKTQVKCYDRFTCFSIYNFSIILLLSDYCQSYEQILVNSEKNTHTVHNQYFIFLIVFQFYLRTIYKHRSINSI